MCVLVSLASVTDECYIANLKLIVILILDCFHDACVSLQCVYVFLLKQLQHTLA